MGRGVYSAVVTCKTSKGAGRVHKGYGGRLCLTVHCLEVCVLTACVQPSLRVQSGKQRFCQKCQNGKPARTHHCRVCNRCVLRMVRGRWEVV